MTLEEEAKLFQLIRGMLTQMVDEIPADDFQCLPPGGGNSPNWILGHLAVANLLGVVTLGGQGSQLKSLLAIYGPGSTPTDDLSVVLSKDALVEVFRESADQLVAAVEGATSEGLLAERDSPLLREQFPTVGEIVRHLLTTHFGIHVGQLSAWRRGRGMDPVLKI